MAANTTPMQPDDNLVNGQTYTFQFQCANWFCLSDLSATLLADITAQAPNFLTSVQVTSPPTTSLYNVQFTYEGDGSDVVSDVAQSIVAACQAVSGDSVTFVGAVAATAQQVTVTPTQAASIAGQTVVSGAQAVVQGVGSVASTAASTVTNVASTAVGGTLTAILPVLIVVVLLVLFVLPSFTKSAGGLSAAVRP